MEKQPKMQDINLTAAELNEMIEEYSPTTYKLLSDLGRRIYLPKGIVSQSAEANEKAHHVNATRAVALEDGHLMHLGVSLQMTPELSTESVFGYPPILGNPELRRLWQTNLRIDNPLLSKAQISLPIVTSGMTHGFSLLADLFVNAGDTLILPDRYWGNYRLIFQTKAGAVINTFPFFDSDWRFYIDGFQKVLTNNTPNKLILLLNFPHNPTGYSVTGDEAEHIRDLIVACADSGCNILVMIDDAYAGFWYDAGVMHDSLFGMLVGCHQNVLPVKVDGATKEEYAWGLRVGFLTFGLSNDVMQSIEQKLSGLIRANTSGAAQVSQTLILEAMKSADYVKQKQRNFEILRTRALKVQQVTKDFQYANLWDVYPNHAGYFICLSLKSGNAESVRQVLLNEHGIGTIALSENELRVAYSCIDEKDIEDVFNKIALAVQDQNPR